MSNNTADIYATPGPFTKFPGEGLPDIKRYITTHNAQGEGIFLPADNGAHQALMANGRGVQNIIYTTHGDAVELNDEVDIAFARDNAVSFFSPHLTQRSSTYFSSPASTSPAERSCA